MAAVPILPGNQKPSLLQMIRWLGSLMSSDPGLLEEGSAIRPSEGVVPPSREVAARERGRQRGLDLRRRRQGRSISQSSKPVAALGITHRAGSWAMDKETRICRSLSFGRWRMRKVQGYSSSLLFSGCSSCCNDIISWSRSSAWCMAAHPSLRLTWKARSYPRAVLWQIARHRLPSSRTRSSLRPRMLLPNSASMVVPIVRRRGTCSGRRFRIGQVHPRLF